MKTPLVGESGRNPGPSDLLSYHEKIAVDTITQCRFYSSYDFSKMQALVPPKPKEFERQ